MINVVKPLIRSLKMNKTLNWKDWKVENPKGKPIVLALLKPYKTNLRFDHTWKTLITCQATEIEDHPHLRPHKTLNQSMATSKLTVQDQLSLNHYLRIPTN